MTKEELAARPPKPYEQELREEVVPLRGTRVEAAEVVRRRHLGERLCDRACFQRRHDVVELAHVTTLATLRWTKPPAP